MLNNKKTLIKHLPLTVMISIQFEYSNIFYLKIFIAFDLPKARFSQRFKKLYLVSRKIKIIFEAHSTRPNPKPLQTLVKLRRFKAF